MMSRLIRFLPALVIGAIIMMPISVQAQTLADREAVVCAQIVERMTGIRNGFQQRKTTYQESAQSQDGDQQSARTKFDEELADKRRQADEKRAGVYERMALNQQSDDGRLAVENYRQAVEKAVGDRRAAYDAARLVFRQKVDSLKAERKQLAADHITTFQNAVEAALVQAQQSCKSSRADKAKVRTELVASLKKARLDYNDFRRSLQPLGEQVKAFANERKTSFEQATAAFEQAMQQARSDFKASTDD